jgi:hypothetical protein
MYESVINQPVNSLMFSLEGTGMNIIKLLLIMYAIKAAPMLPSSINDFLQSVKGKVLGLFLMLWVFTHDPLTSIIIAIIFVFMLHLTTMETFEKISGQIIYPVASDSGDKLVFPEYNSVILPLQSPPGQLLFPPQVTRPSPALLDVQLQQLQQQDSNTFKNQLQSTFGNGNGGGVIIPKYDALVNLGPSLQIPVPNLQPFQLPGVFSNNVTMLPKPLII